MSTSKQEIQDNVKNVEKQTKNVTPKKPRIASFNKQLLTSTMDSLNTSFQKIKVNVSEVEEKIKILSAQNVSTSRSVPGEATIQKTDTFETQQEIVWRTELEKSLKKDVKNPHIRTRTVKFSLDKSDIKDGKPKVQAFVQKFAAPDDHVGHIRAYMFGGAYVPENLFPQNQKKNQGEYKSFELQLKKKLESLNAGVKVGVEIVLYYDSKNEFPLRPIKIKYSYKVVGKDSKEVVEYVEIDNPI